MTFTPRTQITKRDLRFVEVFEGSRRVYVGTLINGLRIRLNDEEVEFDSWSRTTRPLSRRARRFPKRKTTAMTEVTQQDRALTWASLGVPVLICNGNKRPMADLCPRAVYSATTDADTLRSWFRRYRFGLIAIPCGEPSGVVVVDIDCHVGRPNGFRTLAKLGIEPDDISPHFETTPSGGQHRFCRFDGIATSSLPGIDVLSTGRYCLVWGEPLASLEDLPPVPAVLRKSAAPAPTPQVERPLTPVPAWVRREDAGKGISTDWRDLSFSIELLALALRVIPNNDDTTRDDWLKVIMAIHDATGGSEEGLLLAKLCRPRTRCMEPIGSGEKHRPTGRLWLWPFLGFRTKTASDPAQPDQRLAM